MPSPSELERASKESEKSAYVEKEIQAGRGVKDDLGKNRLDLLPPEVIFGLGNALTKGAEYYAEHNWAEGMRWGRVFGAMMRHAWTWWGGEEYDKKSGLHHLESVLFCAMALYVYTVRKSGTDDRFKK